MRRKRGGERYNARYKSADYDVRHILVILVYHHLFICLSFSKKKRDHARETRKNIFGWQSVISLRCCQRFGQCYIAKIMEGILLYFHPKVL